MSFATEQMAKARWNGHGSDWPSGHRPCMKCNVMKPTTEFHRHAKCKGGFNSVCKGCRVPSAKKQHRFTPKERRLLNAAKSRAVIKGRDFNIDISDVQIPDICPVLGIPMTNPSLDRIDSTLGYVKGNVRVISTRANTLKSNASVAEMRLILADLLRIEQSKQPPLN